MQDLQPPLPNQALVTLFPLNYFPLDGVKKQVGLYQITDHKINWTGYEDIVWKGIYICKGVVFASSTFVLTV